MTRPVRIGLIGDYKPDIVPHAAAGPVLAASADYLGIARPEVVWLETAELRPKLADGTLEAFDALWAVPNTPYADTNAALEAIRFARTAPRPFLGTCGGFQNAVIEFARNVLGMMDADHAETNPGGPRLLIAPLKCRLYGAAGGVRFVPGSRLETAYGRGESEERYFCGYGVNPAFREQLAAAGLHPAAHDAEGDLRGVELEGHPFFVATLFQPERTPPEHWPHPLITAFLSAAVRFAESREEASAKTPDVALSS